MNKEINWLEAYLLGKYYMGNLTLAPSILMSLKDMRESTIMERSKATGNWLLGKKNILAIS